MLVKQLAWGFDSPSHVTIFSGIGRDQRVAARKQGELRHPRYARINGSLQPGLFRLFIQR